MSDGKTHGLITTIGGVAVLVAGEVFQMPRTQTVYMAIGCLSGLFLTPDLDQAESHKGIWAAIWWPYGLLMPHRNPLSHWPILGTIGRLAYLWLWAAIIYIIGNDWVRQFISIPQHIGWAIAGLILSDTLHWVTDIISTGSKRYGHRQDRKRN